MTSRRVAANIRIIRKQRGLSTYALSRALAGIGWPIGPGGITRIEAGERRVDVDDLIALGVVLGCSPNRLLLPEVTASGEVIDLAGGVLTTDVRAWEWAAGDSPLIRFRLGADGLPEPELAGAVPGPAKAVFRAENQPHKYTGEPVA